jgi:GT2 family glycosyltransferase
VAQGHSRASEAGVSASTRPYVCLLNSDAIVTPRSWLGMVRAFTDFPQVAVAGPSTSQTPTPQQVTRACHCRHHWSDAQIWCFAQRYVAKHRNEVLVDLPLVGGFAFFVRRSVWDELGGFDRNLPDYGNETEFCQRVTKAGYRVVWSKAGYIHHLGSESYGLTLGLFEIKRRCLETRSYIQKQAESPASETAGGKRS